MANDFLIQDVSFLNVGAMLSFLCAADVPDKVVEATRTICSREESCHL